MNSPLQIELQKPDFSGKTAAEIAALLNAETIEYFANVPTGEVQNNLAKTGIAVKLEIGSESADPIIRGICRTALKLLIGQIASLDLSPTGAIAANMTLVANQRIISNDDVQLIIGWGRKHRSRAMELQGAPVTPEQIQAIWNQAAIEQTQTLIEQLGTAYSEALILAQQTLTSLTNGQSDTTVTREQVIEAFSNSIPL